MSSFPVLSRISGYEVCLVSREEIGRTVSVSHGQTSGSLQPSSDEVPLGRETPVESKCLTIRLNFG